MLVWSTTWPTELEAVCSKEVSPRTTTVFGDHAGISFGSHALRAVDNHIAIETTPHFHPNILAIDLSPGIEPSILRALLKSGACAGLLLKSLGAGNVHSEDEYSLIPVIETATRLYKIPVLVSTKFVGGTTRMDMYEPGKMALDAGAIPTRDMTDVMAQVKFMWALAQGHSGANLRKTINTDHVGEITSLEGKDPSVSIATDTNGDFAANALLGRAFKSPRPAQM